MHLVFCLRFRKLLKALPWPFSIWRFLEIKHYECFRCTLLLCHYSKAWHEHFMLLHFCCSKIKVHLQRMIFFLAMAAFTPHEVVASDHVHGDWTDGPLLVTRIHEGSEKSAVAGYCLHHPGHPHRREPAVQLVMFFVLHVLIFMSGFKIRYYAWWILTRPLAPFHALCIG